MTHNFRLGVDLVKIKEGMVENEPVTNDHNSDDESNQNEDNSSLEDNSLPSVETETAPLSLRLFLSNFLGVNSHKKNLTGIDCWDVSDGYVTTPKNVTTNGPKMVHFTRFVAFVLLCASQLASL